MLTSILIFLTTSIFGAVVWTVRLEGRMNTADQKHADLKGLIEKLFDIQADRLERIERALNGALHKDHT